MATDKGHSQFVADLISNWRHYWIHLRQLGFSYLRGGGRRGTVPGAFLVQWQLESTKLFGSFDGATRTSCMIAFILAGAAFLTVAMGFTGIPRVLAQWVGSLGLSPNMLLVTLTIFFVVLGCFHEGISIVVLTTAVIQPIIEQAGIDRIWFGIFIVIVVEMAQITPPVGFNLFVIQGLTGYNILQVARATLPFFFLLLAAVIIISVFPEIVTYLPELMSRR